MKPKDQLMALANENPHQQITAVEVNGEIKLSFSWSTPGDAMVMLHVLKKAVYESFETHWEKMKNEQNTNPKTTP